MPLALTGLLKQTTIHMAARGRHRCGPLEDEMSQPTVTTISKMEARAERAMVATKDPHATRAGLELLRAGGNAVDAAVAACFANGVVEPNSATIGGGGYIVYQMGDQGGVVGGHMPAPLSAEPTMFSLTGGSATGPFGWAEVEGDANLQGAMSIGVPGVVAAMCEAHRLFGRVPLPEVVAPAVRLARDGFTPGWHNLYAFGLLSDMLFRHAELSRILMPGGKMPAGDNLRPGNLCQPDLADTMETIGREGADAFYRGDLAKVIVEGIRAEGGILAAEDLAAYRPFVWERGMEIDYRGLTVRVPPHATAGVTTAMTLKLLAGFDLPAMGHNSVESLHAFISSARMAYADRYVYLADPATVDVPWKGLLSDAYSDRRRAEIGAVAPRVWSAGDPWVEEGRRPERVFAPSAPALDDGTTHLCVIDEEGNAVSFTNTVGGGFGSGVVPRGTGVLMNNGMMWFDPIPGRVNSILPGRWPLNNAAPALVLGRDGTCIAVGVTGGRRITNAVSQLVSNMVDFGMGPQQAIDAPRVDCSTPRTSVPVELDVDVRSRLEERGHQLTVMGPEYAITGFANFGSPVAVVRPSTGDITAGVDTFHAAHAEGY